MPDPPARIIPRIAVSGLQIVVGHLGGGQRGSQVIVAEHRRDVIVDHPERRGGGGGLPVIRGDPLFDDDHTVAVVRRADLDGGVGALCPRLQRRGPGGRRVPE